MKTVIGCLLVLGMTTASAQWVQVGLAGRAVWDIDAEYFDFNVRPGVVGKVFAATKGSGEVYLCTDLDEGTWQMILAGSATHIALFPYSNSLVAITRDTANRNSPLDSTALILWTDHTESWSLLMSADSVARGDGFVNLEIGLGGAYCARRDDMRLWQRHSVVVLSFNPYGSISGEHDSVGGEVIACGQPAVLGLSTCCDGRDNSAYWHVSTDYGATWCDPIECTKGQLDNSLEWPTAAAWGTKGIAVNGNGIHFSTDTCKSWTRIGFQKSNCLFALPRHITPEFSADILAGTDGNGVVLFSAEGDSLGLWNEGLTNLQIFSLARGSDWKTSATDYIYAGTGDGVWRRDLWGELPTSVGGADNPLPSNPQLQQNYPNPFNPTTTIVYALPHAGNVTLRVYNVLGEEVATLVNGDHAAGTFTATWDASDLPSGVYFYRLTAGDYVQMRKMLLMR